MDFFGRLFGTRQAAEGAQDPQLQHLSQEASRIADEMMKREYVGAAIVTSCTVELGSESPLTKAVDRVLELAPDSPDLLFAKSEAHYARMDGETGLAYRKKALAASPNHFEASMRESHFQDWDHIFTYSGWGDNTTMVPSLMLALQSAGNPVQIVRDGLALTLAVLIPVTRSQFPDVVDCRWKPVWVDTPHGPVFEHYVMLKQRSGEITIAPLCGWFECRGVGEHLSGGLAHSRGCITSRCSRRAAHHQWGSIGHRRAPSTQPRGDIVSPSSLNRAYGGAARGWARTVSWH